MIDKSKEIGNVTIVLTMKGLNQEIFVALISVEEMREFFDQVGVKPVDLDIKSPRIKLLVLEIVYLMTDKLKLLQDNASTVMIMKEDSHLEYVVQTDVDKMKGFSALVTVKFAHQVMKSQVIDILVSDVKLCALQDKSKHNGVVAIIVKTMKDQ
jgi:hypothetical protein